MRKALLIGFAAIGMAVVAIFVAIDPLAKADPDATGGTTDTRPVANYPPRTVVPTLPTPQTPRHALDLIETPPRPDETDEAYSRRLVALQNWAAFRDAAALGDEQALQVLIHLRDAQAEFVGRRAAVQAILQQRAAEGPMDPNERAELRDHMRRADHAMYRGWDRHLADLLTEDQYGIFRDHFPGGVLEFVSTQPFEP